MKLRRYTLEQLKEAVAVSNSVRGVLLKLGLTASAGNYTVFHKAIREYKINISHFGPLPWNKDKKTGVKYPIEDYLSNKRVMMSDTLKKRLFKEKILESRCNRCLLTKWLGEDIPLELHHKDGNHANNNLDNLEILCANCHALI